MRPYSEKGKKTVCGRMVLMGLGILVALAIFESVLRGVGWIYAAWRLPRSAREPHGAIRILCAGDSFTFGIGAPRGMSYPEQLQKIFDARGPRRTEIINAGIPGINSSMLLEDLPRALAQYGPDAVIIMVGCDNKNNFHGSHYYLFLSGPRSDLARLNAKLSWLRTYKLVQEAWTGAGRLWMRCVSRPAAGERNMPSPQSSEAQRALSAVDELDAKDKPREARALLERALKAEPDDAALNDEMGFILENRLHKAQEAACFFSRAAQLAPRSIPEQVRLLEDYNRIGYQDGVKKTLERLHELEPENAEYNAWITYGIPSSGDIALQQKVAVYDLGRIAALCRRQGIIPIFQTYAEPSWWPNDAIRQASRINRVSLIDNRTILRGKDYLSYHAEDGHLNAAGYRLMAESDYRQLLPILAAHFK